MTKHYMMHFENEELGKAFYPERRAAQSAG